MQGEPDHARFVEWFKHCLTDAVGPSPKRRRMLEGFNKQKIDALGSGENLTLDLGRLVAFSGVDWALDAVAEAPAALADVDQPKQRGLQRRHTL